ncbi:MAG: hypothetical protein ACFFG0_43900 [Candidatus Thorarchaeota archaeon]
MKKTEWIGLYGFKGYGTTDSKIVKFSEMLKVSEGVFFEENHSSGYNDNKSGLEITIKKPCIIIPKFYISNGDVKQSVGISLNSTELNTNINNISSFAVAFSKLLKKNSDFLSGNIISCTGDMVNNKVQGLDILRFHTCGFNLINVIFEIKFFEL